MPDSGWILAKQRLDTKKLDTKENRRKITTKNPLVSNKSIDSEEDEDELDEKKAYYEPKEQKRTKSKHDGICIDSAHIGNNEEREILIYLLRF